MAAKQQHTSGAAALKDGKKPGPKDAPVQIRPAGKANLADKPENWDKQDEALDESFPSSDPVAKY
ncbi:MAG TPA: hypothetical protein VL133_04230 [Devosia sp.]|nr:hypothetical protein [Devosia sp.]